MSHFKPCETMGEDAVCRVFGALRMVPQALKWRMGPGQRLTEDSPKQDLLSFCV